jgi:hypothetical protein
MVAWPKPAAAHRGVILLGRKGKTNQAWVGMPNEAAV